MSQSLARPIGSPCFPLESLVSRRQLPAGRGQEALHVLPRYRRLLADAGFTDVAVEVTRVYDPKELAESAGSGESCCGSDCCGTFGEWDLSAYGRFASSGGRLVSAFVRARKP